MATSFRKATMADIELALDVLASIKATSSKQWVKQTSREAAMPYLAATVAGDTGAVALVIEGGLLLIVRQGINWETGQLRLFEEMMVRIGPGGTLKDVTSVAEEVAKGLGATSVVFGTAFSERDATLSAAYQRLGYQEAARLLYKEL